MAILIDAATDAITATSNLPSNTSFTIMMDCLVVSDLGAGTGQMLLAATNAAYSEGLSVAWEAAGIDGTMQQIATGAAGANFASRPAVRRPFVFYFRCSSNSAGFLQSGWRYDDGNWVRVSGDLPAAVDQMARIEFGRVTTIYYANCMIQNIKVWNRVLSDAEIDIESGHADVFNKAGLNFYAPCPHHNDVFDRGPHGRNLTKGGTLTTGYFNFKRPTKPIRRPVPYEVAGGGGGTFQILAGRKFSLAGMAGLAGD